MNKLPVLIMGVFVLFAISFGTWQLFMGNLEAAFSTFPFLVVAYLFLKPRQR